jgi:hypothetical protein
VDRKHGAQVHGGSDDVMFRYSSRVISRFMP